MTTIGYRAAKGERVYAIGDVHGCEDLLIALLAKIRADAEMRAPAQTRIVLLGDVVDRGPASSSLMRRLLRYTRMTTNFTVLLGNHEQLMSAAVQGDLAALATWVGLGGDQTLASFGVPAKLIGEGSTARLLDQVRRLIEPELVLWMERLPLMVRSGDLVFVHAGIRPGVPLLQQKANDLLWIRNPFLTSEEHRDYFTVHGHTISVGGPDVRPNRLGIDTGAYESGKLTAVGFENEDYWILST